MAGLCGSLSRVPSAQSEMQLQCHKVSLDVNENQPCPMESGEPIWEIKFANEERFVNLMVGNTFGAYRLVTLDSFRGICEVSNKISLVRHIDGKVADFEIPTIIQKIEIMDD
jgi:hypothetical protein